MGFLARRREEQAAQEAAQRAETDTWIAWVKAFEANMPSDGVLTVETAEQLRVLPVTPRDGQMKTDIARSTCRHYTSQLAGRLSRKAILESSDARTAGDTAAADAHRLRSDYMSQISDRLAL